MNYVWYEFVAVTSALTYTFTNSLRIEGYCHVPQQGPVLVVANHQSFLDPNLVGLAVRRHLHYLARSTLFRHPAFAALIRSLNAVPVNQEGFAREGLQTTMELLKEGKAVIVFPEGERTPDGRMCPLRPGIHLLIKKLDIPILPVGIAGAFEAWPRHRMLPRPAPLFLPPQPGAIALSVGRPLQSTSIRKRSREEVMGILFDEIQKAHMRAEQLRRR